MTKECKPVFSLNLLGPVITETGFGDPRQHFSYVLFDWRWLCSGRDAVHLFTGCLLEFIFGLHERSSKVGPVGKVQTLLQCLMKGEIRQKTKLHLIIVDFKLGGLLFPHLT